MLTREYEPRMLVLRWVFFFVPQCSPAYRRWWRRTQQPGQAGHVPGDGANAERQHYHG